MTMLEQVAEAIGTTPMTDLGMGRASLVLGAQAGAALLQELVLHKLVYGVAVSGESRLLEVGLPALHGSILFGHVIQINAPHATRDAAENWEVYVAIREPRT